MSFLQTLSFWWSLPYMRWDMLFIFIPTFLLWVFGWRYFRRYKKTFLFVAVFSFLWGLPFDILATPVFHIYFYNPVHNLGVSFLGIPLEEYFFLAFVPQEMTAITLVARKILYG